MTMARGGVRGGERATGAAGEARVVVGEDETRRVRTTDGRTPRGAEGASATGPRAPRRTTRIMRTRNPVGSGRSSVPVQPAPQTRVEEEPRGDAHRERDRRHLDARRVRHRHRADACAGGERARADREAAAKTTSRESARAKSARRGDGIVVIFSEASDSLTGRRVVRQVRPAARSTLSSSFPCAASFAPSLASPPPSSAPPPPPRARVSPRRVVATPARPRDILHEPVVPVPPRGVRDASRVEDVRGDEALLDVPVVVLVPALVPREHLAVRRRVPSVLRRFGAKGGGGVVRRATDQGEEDVARGAPRVARATTVIRARARAPCPPRRRRRRARRARAGTASASRASTGSASRGTPSRVPREGARPRSARGARTIVERIPRDDEAPAGRRGKMIDDVRAHSVRRAESRDRRRRRQCRSAPRWFAAASDHPPPRRGDAASAGRARRRARLAFVRARLAFASARASDGSPRIVVPRAEASPPAPHAPRRVLRSSSGPARRPRARPRARVRPRAVRPRAGPRLRGPGGGTRRPRRRHRRGRVRDRARRSQSHRVPPRPRLRARRVLPARVGARVLLRGRGRLLLLGRRRLLLLLLLLLRASLRLRPPRRQRHRRVAAVPPLVVRLPPRRASDRAARRREDAPRAPPVRLRPRQRRHPLPVHAVARGLRPRVRVVRRGGRRLHGRLVPDLQTQGRRRTRFFVGGTPARARPSPGAAAAAPFR